MTEGKVVVKSLTDDGSAVEKKSIYVSDVADKIATILRRDFNITGPDHLIKEFVKSSIEFNNTVVELISSRR